MQQTTFNLPLFSRYLYREIFEPIVYILSIVIGSIVCLLTGIISPVPFLVPCVVQILARSSIKFKQRHKEALIELPGQKEDPVFIMGNDGYIILSIGRTKQMFDSFEITNLTEFIKEDGLQAVMKLVARFKPGQKLETTEFYSGITDKWYELKAKPANIEHVGVSDAILVWMQDITIRKSFDHQLSELLRFSSSMVFDLNQLVESHTVYVQLARFVLKDYGAIFITREDSEGNIKGFVFKKGENGLEQSREIKLLKESAAPIFISRRISRILSDDIIHHANEAEFLKNNPFDHRVTEFIADSLRNFITYNEGDVSIIAFNYKSTITAYEKQYIEVLLNMTRTILLLSDFAAESRVQKN